MSKFHKVSGYKNNLLKFILFLCFRNNYPQNELKLGVVVPSFLALGRQRAGKFL